MQVDSEVRCPKQEAQRIVKYVNADLVCSDVLGEFNQLKKACLARAVKVDGERERPERKTFFEAPCPLWFKESGAKCTKDKVAWQCMVCFKQVRIIWS